ncbi:MAG: polysaccharide biosynthesis protein [Tenericutes bacterium]|nr:polysaccharide biosynthesis protein [Mycoplasmatota bacterium]
MKRNSFVEGTIMASFSLIFIKILGAVYVIPFYSIVGELGGALYSYAYTVYSLVINICTTGLPLAISKIVSEYNTLEMYEAKERTLKLGNKIVFVLSVVLFLLMFIFAKEAAYLFIGNSTGGNSIEEIELVIRSISFCLLIVPLLSIKKGYLQGQKFISVSTNSQVIEQVVRISIILIGSYLAINVYHLKVSYGVAIAVFGAFIAGIAAYMYLNIKIKNNVSVMNIPKTNKKDKVSDKTIVKKILSFSIPLIIVSIAMDLYNMTDLSLIIRGLLYLGYSASEAETIGSVMATWAPKICLIVNTVAVGLSITLIPHMVSYLVKKDYKAINYQFIKSLGIIIVVGLPMAAGISLLSNELYTMFYGYSEYGGIILRLIPFSILFTNLNFVVSMVLQSLSKFKTVYFSTFTGLIINATLDIPLMILCDKLGIYPYYGVTFATMIGTTISLIISLSSLKKDLKFEYKGILSILKKMIIPMVIMCAIVFGLEMYLKDIFNTRITMLIASGICALVGASIFGIITYKNKLLYDVLGEEYVNKILYKFKLKKSEV